MDNVDTVLKNGDCQFELEKRELAENACAKGRLPY